MNVFEFRSYRAALESLFSQEKQLRGARWSIARLGEKTQIQPSYLTNVTKLRAHLSSDQIYAVGEALSLSAAEIEFLNLLMEWERASHRGRKEELQKRIENFRREHLNVPRQVGGREPALSELEKQKYYLDPNIELIHLYLGTDHAPTDPKEIARAWGLSEQVIIDVLAFLQKSGLVQLKGKKWVLEPIRQYLPRESPIVKPQQLLKRLRAIEAIQKMPEEEAYTFSATVIMNDETKQEVQARFIEFYKGIERLFIASPSENVYHFQFELFPWITKK